MGGGRAMTIAELLSELSESNVQLWPEGHRLRYRAAKGVLTPELLARIAQNKQEILAYLQASQLISLYPLSYGQQALWFLHKMVPDSIAYNQAFSARICST